MPSFLSSCYSCDWLNYWVSVGNGKLKLRERKTSWKTYVDRTSPHSRPSQKSTELRKFHMVLKLIEKSWFIFQYKPQKYSQCLPKHLLAALQDTLPINIQYIHFWDIVLLLKCRLCFPLLCSLHVKWNILPTQGK